SSTLSLLIERSTFNSNNAGGNGGGAFATSSPTRPVTITNSTFSANSANTNGGGLFAPGVGTTITHSTIVGNVTNGRLSTSAGGLAASSTIIHHTIVADNFKSGGTTRSDIGGTVNSTSSYNLISDGAGSGLTNNSNGNQLGTTASPINPMLGPLQNNGGPTLT